MKLYDHLRGLEGGGNGKKRARLKAGAFVAESKAAFYGDADFPPSANEPLYEYIPRMRRVLKKTANPHYVLVRMMHS